VDPSVPNPIIEICFDKLDYEPKKGLIGDPCRKIEILNDIPAGLGRHQVCVCQLSEGEFFYCGGYVADNMRETDLSLVSAIFSVRTKKWEVLPTMPQGRCDAVACLSDEKIIIFGGFVALTNSVSTVLCFDLSQKRWLDKTEHGIPDNDFLRGYDFAKAKLHDGRIVLAGKSYIDDYHESYGPLVGSSCEVQSFEPLSKVWSRLPDMEHKLSSQTGILLAYGHFAVLTKNFFTAYDFNNQRWYPLPQCTMKKNREIIGVARINQHMIVAIGTIRVKIYDELHRQWFDLPLKHTKDIFDDGDFSVIADCAVGSKIGVFFNNTKPFGIGTPSHHN
jgi:hypothetical protein